MRKTKYNLPLVLVLPVLHGCGSGGSVTTPAPESILPTLFVSSIEVGSAIYLDGIYPSYFKIHISERLGRFNPRRHLEGMSSSFREVTTQKWSAPDVPSRRVLKRLPRRWLFLI